MNLLMLMQSQNRVMHLVDSLSCICSDWQWLGDVAKWQWITEEESWINSLVSVLLFWVSLETKSCAALLCNMVTGVTIVFMLFCRFNLQTESEFACSLSLYDFFYILIWTDKFYTKIKLNFHAKYLFWCKRSGLHMWICWTTLKYMPF